MPFFPWTGEYTGFFCFFVLFLSVPQATVGQERKDKIDVIDLHHKLQDNQ